jgi:TonB family protein
MPAARILGLASLLPLLVAATPPTLPPGFTFSDDDYPIDARRAEEQGAVRFDVAVGADGRPTRCTVVKSSGSQRLDKQSCDIFMRRARYTPATDDAGLPVAGTVRHDTSWFFWVDGTRTRYVFGGYSVNVTFDAAGAVTSCVVSPIPEKGIVDDAYRNKCEAMGSAQTFADLLGRSTVGFASASFRFYLKDVRVRTSLPTRFSLHRELVHVVYDRTDNGSITWCQVDVPPVSSSLGLNAEDLCGPDGFGVTSAAGGGLPVHLVVDIVASA